MIIITVDKKCICCNYDQLHSSPAVLMPFVAKRVFGYDPIEITHEWGMRDLKSGTSYFPAKTMQCQECGTLFLNYRFNDDQMYDLYRDYRGKCYTQQRDFYEPGYASGVGKDFNERHSYIEAIEGWLSSKLPKNPLVLDWGGGDGLNSPFLKNQSVHIYDISGVEVTKGAQSVKLNQIYLNKYDLITSLQVFEHVPYPINLLQEMVKVMQENTLLYIEVPNENLMRYNRDNFDLVNQKKFWHEHINFYTETGLRRMCARAELTVLDTHYECFDNGVRKGEVMGVLAKRNFNII